MRRTLVIMVALLAAVVRPAAAQRLADIVTSGPGPRATSPAPDAAPAATGADGLWREVRLPAVVFAGSGGLGVSAAFVGLVVDTKVCEHRERNEDQSSFFGPCLFPAERWTAVGWYGGTVAGATIAGYTAARRWDRCPARSDRQRLVRAVAAAVVGTAPALLHRTIHDGNPDTDAALIAATPLTQGLAAAVLLRRCGA